MKKPITSERRAQIVIVSLIIVAVCAYGKGVKVWTVQEVFGVVGVAAAALVTGMSKSPRDAALSDQASGESGDAKVTSVTTTDTHEEVKQPGGKDETNKGPAVVPRAAAGQ